MRRGGVSGGGPGSGSSSAPSIVRSALRAGGTFGYANPNVYVHDMMGLTDRHVTLHGTVYYRSIGKTDLAYTYDAVRPNLILVHSGYNLLSRMVRASDGEYNDTYSSVARADTLLALFTQVPGRGFSVLPLKWVLGSLFANGSKARALCYCEVNVIRRTVFHGMNVFPPG